MQVKKVVTLSLLRTCRRFLARDPEANVLSLGDLYSPLIKVSDVYGAFRYSQVVGVCTIYRAFSTPSIVLGTGSLEAKQALIKKALNSISNKFISLCQPDDINVFKRCGATILCSYPEQQMITDSLKKIECEDIKVEKVGKKELELLNLFYVEHHSEAWAPIQFKAGPYYCVKHNGKIVSAAGVSLVTPQIAQLGNIVTDEAYRNLGLATACTNTLTNHLVFKGRIVSLYVRTNNTPAIHMYEKLGFHKAREIAFLVMRKNNLSHTDK
jgi:GNAT superfamily N-acetyltransferase